MVIAGAADRIPHRVDALVFLDALVPLDGESCWDLVSEEERQWYLGVDESGFGVPPMLASYERVRDDPQWMCHELDGRHNLMRDNPEDLVRTLLGVVS